MKTVVGVALSLLTFVLSARAEANYVAREIKPAGSEVYSAALGALPSAVRPQGTVVVSTRTSTMEVDVANGTIVVAQPFPCTVLHRLAGVLVGICDGDIVAFDSSLVVTWRAHWSAPEQLVAKGLFTNNRGLVVATYRGTSSELVIRVASMIGTPISELHTPASLVDGRGRAEIYFHGATVFAYAWHGSAMRNSVLVLSYDQQHVRAQRALTNFDTAWDDGTNIHVSSGVAIDKNGNASTDQRDLTLDDALRPIASIPLARPIAQTVAAPQVDGLGGSGVLEELDLGANHFWLTFGCCGDRGGLFVAKVR